VTNNYIKAYKTSNGLKSETRLAKHHTQSNTGKPFIDYQARHNECPIIVQNQSP